MEASQERVQFFGFGVFEVDRKTREFRKQGRRIRLQDQPFQILCRLLDHPGEVVTRETLRRELWPGSVYVDFDHGLNNAIAKLREALGDNATSPQYIETLPRLGYRFIYPLRGQSLQRTELPQPPQPEPTQTPLSPRQPRRSRVPLLVAVTFLLGALSVGVWLSWRDPPDSIAVTALAGMPSVAVLPFVSLGLQAEDEDLAAGLTEALLDRLSRIRGLRVAGATSSFRFENSSLPPAAIAKALNVDHLLEGSVRRSGNRVRIAAQLVDARDGHRLWSETFEYELRDTFDVEDDIALSVASAIQVRLADADRDHLRRHGTDNAEAYRLYLTGIAEMRGHRGRQDAEEARRRFEQAITLDPNFGAAYAGLASYYFQASAVTYREPEEGARLGGEAAERAVALDPDASEALRAKANFEMWAYRFRGEAAAYSRADTVFRRALELDPSNAFAYFDYARAIQWCEPQRALRLFERSAELDPLAPPVALGLSALAMSRLGMNEAAAKRVDDVVARAAPAYSSPSAAAFHAYTGRLDRAAQALSPPPAVAASVGTRLLRWSIHMSLGDASAAAAILGEAVQNPLTETLSTAAVLASGTRNAEAFALLDERRSDYPLSRMLDLPTARLALIAGRDDAARVILEERLPDLATGGDPICAPRVLPALDLVLAWLRTGRERDARDLLDRVATFLDGPGAPRMSLFTVQRARAHALAGETQLARQALERAYVEGFRLTCGLDLQPQPLLYVDCIDADPAFAAVRREVGFDDWLERIRTDNQRQLAQLRSSAASRAQPDAPSGTGNP